MSVNVDHNDVADEIKMCNAGNENVKENRDVVNNVFNCQFVS